MTNSAAPFDAFASASTMLAALQAGQISAMELLEFHLERIARYNPQLNAIVIPNEEQARRQASAADEARARGESPGALHGLPLTIKDCIEVAGLRTTAGVKSRAETVSSQNGPVAQRVFDAGGVLIGKTNVPPYAGDWQADNPIFGRTNNPWDLERTPGGSTGGGAAALAAGLTPLEFGSDIGGSIRVPAAFCGVYGHRPSETAVPRHGHFPGSPVPNPALVMAVQGPLARSAADLELALNVISGPIVGEDVAWRLEIPEARRSTLSAFRVAILPRPAWLPVDAEIAAALDDLATRLGRLGAKVAEAQPQGFDLHAHEETYGSLLNAIMYSDMKDEPRAQLAQTLQQSPDPIVRAQARGVAATARQYLGMLVRREHHRAAFRAFFRDWDVLLAPVTITSAFPHISYKVPLWARTLQVNGETVTYTRLQVYPGIAASAGCPRRPSPGDARKTACQLACKPLVPTWRTAPPSPLPPC